MVDVLMSHLTHDGTMLQVWRPRQ